MNGDWAGLEQFSEHIEYWTDVHQYLIAHSQTGYTDEPLFGLPYLDGHRLMIPDFPGTGPSTSDSWRWHSIVHEFDCYTHVYSGFSRGNNYTDRPALSSTCFEYTSKHFLLVYLAESVRSARSLRNKPDAVSVRFLNRGVAEGWEAVPEEGPLLSPALDTTFRHIEAPESHLYVAGDYQTQPTFYLDKSWYEISRMCAEGIPGIDHIPIPGAPEPR